MDCTREYSALMDIETFFTVLLLVLCLLVAVFEFGAIFLGKTFKESGERPERGTISWHVWWLRARWWGRAIALPLWGWAFYHFFFEPAAWLPPVWWDDYALVALLVLLGIFVVKPRKREL